MEVRGDQWRDTREALASYSLADRQQTHRVRWSLARRPAIEWLARVGSQYVVFRSVLLCLIPARRDDVLVAANHFRAATQSATRSRQCAVAIQPYRARYIRWLWWTRWTHQVQWFNSPALRHNDLEQTYCDGYHSSWYECKVIPQSDSMLTYRIQACTLIKQQPCVTN